MLEALPRPQDANKQAGYVDRTLAAPQAQKT
jgi:hypothetical protein